MNEAIETVQLSGFTVWFWGIVITRAFALFVIVHTIYKDRRNPATSLLISFISCFTYTYIKYNLTSLPKATIDWNYTIYEIVQIICVFIAVYFMSEKTTGKKMIFRAVFVYFLTVIKSLFSAVISFAIINSFMPQVYLFDSSNNDISILSKVNFYTVCILTVILPYPIAYIVNLFKYRKEKTFQLKYAVFYFLPLVGLIPIFTSLVLPADSLPNGSSNSAYNVLNNIIICIDAVLCFSVIFVIDKIEIIDEKNKQLTIIATKNELEYQSALVMNNEQEHLRQIRHDIRNINKTVKELIAAGEIEEAMKMLDESTDEVTKISGITPCRNNIINTVLYMKSNEAQEQGIAILSEINETADCKVSDIDISRILLNLCDNAINATKECDERQIKINIEINDKLIKINTENHYIPHKAKKPLPDHGNGTKIIKQISKKYGGEFKISKSEEIYQTYTYLRNINII